MFGHRRVRRAGAASIAVLALVACGGRTGVAVDLGRLNTQVVGPNAAAASGLIAAKVTVALTGVPAFARPFTIGVNGPFRSAADGGLPEYDLQLGLRDYGAELSSVGGRSFISVGDTGYELPPAIRGRLVTAAARGANALTALLEQFGIAPWRWETHKRVGGTERLGGVAVARVETGVDVARFLTDANVLAGLLGSLDVTRAAGLPPRIPARAREILVGSVRSAAGTSWIGLADGVLRKARLAIAFAVAPGQRRELGGISGGTVTAELDVSQVGSPEAIGPPHKLDSFATFDVLLDAIGDQVSGR